MSKAVIDAAELAPAILVEHGHDHFSLIYADLPAHEDVFRARGLPGGGTTWRAMLIHLLEEYAPEAIESIEIYPEPTSLTIVSDQLDALREVAKLLRKLQDESVVRDLVEHGDLRQYE